MSTSTPSAFISYSREDSEFALRLAQDLKAAGASVWLDQLDIKPGHPWDNAIELALESASQMLVILSPSSARSPGVRDEISYALEQGKVIIPVLYMECVVPLRLQRSQRIDFRSDYTRGLAALLSQLRVDQPDQAVLDQAAEAEAKRHAAWKAREAETQRKKEEAGAFEAAPAEDASAASATPPQPAARKKSMGMIIGISTVAVLIVAAVAAYLLYPQMFQPSTPAAPNTASVDSQHSAEATQAQASSPVPQPAPTVALPQPVAPPAQTPTHAPAPLQKQEKPATPQPVPHTEPALSQPPARTPGTANQPRPGANSQSFNQQGIEAFNRKDFATGVTLLQRGCDQGEAGACTTLGTAYGEGHGVPRDERKAVVLFQKACDGNGPMGCRKLAAHYFSGNGVPTSRPTAQRFYQKACSLGDKFSCDFLKNKLFN